MSGHNVTQRVSLETVALLSPTPAESAFCIAPCHGNSPVIVPCPPTIAHRASVHAWRNLEEDEDAHSPQRDKDVWLSDGNIVAIAEKKVAFWVHKSILSLRSEIICDLFSLPDGDAATTETMDGCPVVHISDSPNDIRGLLLVLWCGKKYVNSANSTCVLKVPPLLAHSQFSLINSAASYYYNRDVLVPVPFKVLASLVCMAHKYVIQDVLDDALSHLKKYYTNSLAAWHDPAARVRYVMATDHDALQAVELARLTNTPLLLLAALLVCVGLASGFPVADDGAAAFPLSALSVPDQARLVHAKGFLAQACATRALHLFAAVPCMSCTSRRA